MQSKQDILNTLLNGGIILFPTDTIWGLGCLANNIDAVKKIFAIKKRDFSKPFPLLVNGIEMLNRYVENVHPRIETLHGFHEHPLTIIYPKAKSLLPPVIHESGSVAIRIVKDAFCQSLIEELNTPLVATSANFSGEPFPLNYSSIDSELFQKVDLVVQHRQNEKSHGSPSVIAKYDDEGNLHFIRN